MSVLAASYQAKQISSVERARIASGYSLLEQRTLAVGDAARCSELSAVCHDQPPLVGIWMLRAENERVLETGALGTLGLGCLYDPSRAHLERRRYRNQPERRRCLACIIAQPSRSRANSGCVRFFCRQKIIFLLYRLGPVLSAMAHCVIRFSQDNSAR